MLGGTSSPTTSTQTDKANVSLGPLILFAASPGTIIGVITMHDISTRFMGLVVLAMGTQFLLGGLKSFFPEICWRPHHD